MASVDCTTRLRPTYCYKDDFCFYALFAKAYFLDDVTHAERFSFEQSRDFYKRVCVCAWISYKSAMLIKI